MFFDYLTMEPLIAGPPFVRALEELVTAAKLGVAAPDQMTPEAAPSHDHGGPGSHGAVLAQP